MTSHELRKEFLITIGKTYEQYGYPEYCGWVEGLLFIESKEWNQRGISDRLSDIFRDSKFPTSVPSVNRALKLLEAYGAVEKSGSRKTGYTYRIKSSTNLVYSMLYQFQSLNQDFIMKMKNLSSKVQKQDSQLKKAINAEIRIWTEWSRVVEKMLEMLSE